MNQSDFDEAELAEQWEDIEVKTLLAQIGMELTQIRMLMQNQSEESDNASAKIVECEKCGWVGQQNDQERHAQSKHKAPAEISDSLFHAVD